MSSRPPKSLLSGLILILLAQYPVACSAESIQPTAEEKAQVEFERKPNSYFEERLKEPQVRVDGQRLHPKYQYYLEERASRGGDLSPEEKRRQQAEKLKDPEIAARMRASVDRSWTFRTKETADMASVEDREIPGPAGPVDVRVYTPHTDQTAPLPVLVYYHGGGWLFGSIEAVDRAVRLIANEADVIVVSVDYRMAPAHKFPAAHEDAFAVFDWVSENAEALGGDPSRIGVGGDSVGGVMSIALSYKRVQEGKTPPSVQLLYYPVADMRDVPYASYDLFRVGYGLDMPFINTMSELVYADPADRNHVYTSPLAAKSFAGMPPAIIATAGFDPLRDHGRAYAERLVDDGVTVHYSNYASLIHGFMQFSGTIDAAEKACVESAQLFGTMIRQ
jgi:acetyl esterase